MDMLRWILLLLGAAVVAGVYLYTSHQRQQRGMRRPNSDDEPVIEGISLKAESQEISVQEMQDELINLDALLKDEIEETQSPAAEPVAGKPEKKPKKDKKEKKPAAKKKRPDAEMFVVLHVASHLPELFRGDAVLEALNDCGLEFGELGIFHRQRELGGRRRILYSVASMVKPGTLKPEDLDSGIELPGLSLFMRLPSFIAGEELYTDLLDCTQRLADKLGGRILDEHRSVLTQQAMEQALEDIRLFELKHGQP